MDTQAFTEHLRRAGKSQSAVARSIRLTESFADWLGTEPDQASGEQLRAYVAELERSGSAKTSLWALAAFFDYVGAADLATLARELRRARIKPAPLRIAEFSGLDPETPAVLAEEGISTTDQMLEFAASAAERKELARRTGLDTPVVEDLFEMARLACIRGVRDTRARLYRGAVGTVEAVAALEPEALIAATNSYIERTGFAGIPPTPKEAAFTVAEARKLTAT